MCKDNSAILSSVISNKESDIERMMNLLDIDGFLLDEVNSPAGGTYVTYEYYYENEVGSFTIENDEYLYME